MENKKINLIERRNKDLVYPDLQGYALNPNRESTNSLPPNSEGLTCLSNFNKREKVVSINGGWIFNTTIPECSFGGNNLLFKKCLSNVNMILDSACDSLDTFLSLKPNGVFLTLYPFFINNSTTSFGKFSSERNFNLFLEEDIFFFSDEFRGICQNRKNSRSCEGGKIIMDDFVNANSCSEQFQNLPDHDPCSFKSKGASADFRICNDIFVNLNSHNIKDNNEIFKSFDFFGSSDYFKYKINNKTEEDKELTIYFTGVLGE